MIYDLNRNSKDHLIPLPYPCFNLLVTSCSDQLVITKFSQTRYSRRPSSTPVSSRYKDTSRSYP